MDPLAVDSTRSSSKPALIQIYLPGSICPILIAGNSTLNTGVLTFDVTASYKGVFRYEGLEGEGSAVPLQTVTYALTSAETCVAKLQTGRPSGGVEVVPLVASDAIGTLMFGGTTLITGSSIGGNCTYVLADATKVGFRKKFKVITVEITTNDFVITVTDGVTDDIDDVVLATITFAGGSTTLNTEVTLSWGGAWITDAKSKTVPVFG